MTVCQPANRSSRSWRGKPIWQEKAKTWKMSSQSKVNPIALALVTAALNHNQALKWCECNHKLMISIVNWLHSAAKWGASQINYLPQVMVFTTRRALRTRLQAAPRRSLSVSRPSIQLQRTHIIYPSHPTITLIVPGHQPIKLMVRVPLCTNRGRYLPFLKRAAKRRKRSKCYSNRSGP